VITIAVVLRLTRLLYGQCSSPDFLPQIISIPDSVDCVGFVSLIYDSTRFLAFVHHGLLLWHRVLHQYDGEGYRCEMYVNNLIPILPTITDRSRTDEDGTVSSSDRSTDEFTWTEEEETAVRRKLDRVVVPISTFLYLLCFLDRYVQKLDWLMLSNLSQYKYWKCSNSGHATGSQLGRVPIQLGYFRLLHCLHVRGDSQ
jgi:hypothetical protein